MPTATIAAPAADASRLVMLLLLRCCCCSRRCCCPASCCCCVVCSSCWAAARTHTDCLPARNGRDDVRNALRCCSTVCCIVPAMCMRLRQATDLTVHAAQTMSWGHRCLYRHTQCKGTGSAAYFRNTGPDVGRRRLLWTAVRAMSRLEAVRHAQRHNACDACTSVRLAQQRAKQTLWSTCHVPDVPC
jgi:hypothetical protein